MKQIIDSRCSLRTLQLLLVVAVAALMVCGGCKNDAAGEQSQQSQGPDGTKSAQGPNDPGQAQGEGDMPWPPPGGQQAPVPPGVTAVMSKMMNAFNEKDAKGVERYFVTREAFMNVSDCDPVDVVDRVMDGRRQAGERAGREGGNARFEGWKNGFIFELKKGDKPAECRAREAVGLYMARFDWAINGKKEVGEAHFLRINGVWYFAKF